MIQIYHESKLDLTDFELPNEDLAKELMKLMCINGTDVEITERMKYLPSIPVEFQYTNVHGKRMKAQVEIERQEKKLWLHYNGDPENSSTEWKEIAYKGKVPDRYKK